MSDYMKEQHESTLAQHGRTGMNRASSFQGPFDNRTQGRAQGSCYNVMPSALMIPCRYRLKLYKRHAIIPACRIH